MVTGRLRGKRALITGTGSGIGRAAARLFAQEGASVVGVDLRDAEESADALRADGLDVYGLTADLGDSGAATAVVDEAADRLGGLDVLWNNASANRPGAIDTLDPSDWDFVLRNELTLVYQVIRAAWPYLRSQGGTIVNTGSIAATSGNGYFPQSAHHAAKAGVVGLTIQVAMEGAAHGIRANCVSPSHITTPQTAALTDEEYRRKSLERYPLGRLGTVEDVAYAGLFLASDESSWITGVNLVVDGGRTAGIAPAAIIHPPG